MKVLLTGANGFVGSGLLDRLAAEPEISAIHAAGRRPVPDLRGLVRNVMGEIAPGTDWLEAVRGVDIVVHLAARVHVMREATADPLADFRRVNVAGTLALARQAAVAGVRRFVFLSSVKVHGEEGSFSEADVPAPRDPYGLSKLEAEEGLRRLSAETGMETVVIRPPLVYGPGVKANFQSLIHAVDRGWPLPLGAVDNRRSLVGRDNLVDFIVRTMKHPAAANETFLISDGEDISTPELVRRLARVMNRAPRLIPVPVGLLRLGAAILGRRGMAQRLSGSLQLNISKARQRLQWSPPVSLDEGLRRTIVAERNER